MVTLWPTETVLAPEGVLSGSGAPLSRVTVVPRDPMETWNVRPRQREVVQDHAGDLAVEAGGEVHADGCQRRPE